MKLQNAKRIKEQESEYDPVRGIGCILERKWIKLSDSILGEMFLPDDFCRTKFVRSLVRSKTFASFCQKEFGDNSKETVNRVWEEFIQLRCRYDFEFWAILFVKIKDKYGETDIPFRLNGPQRKLLGELERQRTENVPIRVILLKARQWGGSTLVQIYMAWIQLVHKRNWNSTICAHVKNAAQNVKGMYSKVIKNYPDYLCEGVLEFRPFERSANTSVIPARGCKVVIGSAEEPDGVRGEDTAMAHCTEVGLWKNTKEKTPEGLIRSVCGGIGYFPYTVIVYESTANGTGNYFHKEWQRAKKGESDKVPVFVAWFEIERYSMPIDNEDAFIEGMDEYEHWLFEKGATLESINWYRHKRREFSDPADMMAEYPSDDVEAFKHSGEIVFNAYQLEKLKSNCCDPCLVGDVVGRGLKGDDCLRDLRFEKNEKGYLKIWRDREIAPIKNRYIVVMDVGGRSAKSDYSVIAVFDRMGQMSGGVPILTAQWRGHTDHDLLAWKAVQVARYYNDALLVIESNTYESEQTDGSHSEYILDQISSYCRLYSRHSAERIREGLPAKWGFHTNRSTKTMIIDSMVEALRENGYEERDKDAIDEMCVFEKKKNGSYGAKDGYHDDMVMTRMIGVYVCKTEDPPKEIATMKKREFVRSVY